MKKVNTSVILCISAVICILSLVFMVFALILGSKTEEQSHLPIFDANAEMGYPFVSAEQEFYILSNSNGDFETYICRNAMAEGKTIAVNFASSSENSVLTELWVYGENSRYLGKSGLLRAGEYISRLTLERKPRDGESLIYKVVCYEDETYYSAGTAIGEGIAVYDISDLTEYY